LEIFWTSQVISRGHVTCRLHAIRQMSIMNNWNPEWLRKIFICIFTCEKADIPFNCPYGVLLVQGDRSRGVYKWNFFLTAGHSHAYLVFSILAFIRILLECWKREGRPWNYFFEHIFIFYLNIGKQFHLENKIISL